MPNTDPKPQYFIDSYILGIFMHLTDPNEIEDAFANYNKIVLQLVNDAYQTYIIGSSLNVTKKVELIKKYTDLLNQEQDLTKEQIQSFTGSIKSEEFEKIAFDIVNEFNALMYKRFSPELSQEEKNDLNSYLDTMEKINNNLIDILKKAQSFIDIPSNSVEEQVSTATNNDLMRQEPIVIQEPTQQPVQQDTATALTQSQIPAQNQQPIQEVEPVAVPVEEALQNLSPVAPIPEPVEQTPAQIRPQIPVQIERPQPETPSPQMQPVQPPQAPESETTKPEAPRPQMPPVNFSQT